MAAAIWVTAVRVTAYVLNNFSMAASMLEISGVCRYGRCCCELYVLDSDVLVTSASVMECGVCMADVVVSCVSESDVMVVDAAGVTP
jgi:hypothetical protein